jgi:hypothetical protein
MRVEIDPTGRHHQPAGVDQRAAHAVGHEIGANGGYPWPDQSDVGHLVEVLARVNDPATAHDRVKHTPLAFERRCACLTVSRRNRHDTMRRT